MDLQGHKCFSATTLAEHIHCIFDKNVLMAAVKKGPLHICSHLPSSGV